MNRKDRTKELFKIVEKHKKDNQVLTKPKLALNTTNRFEVKSESVTEKISKLKQMLKDFEKRLQNNLKNHYKKSQTKVLFSTTTVKEFHLSHQRSKTKFQMVQNLSKN